MKKSKKINFFKRCKMALFELENYIEFINEKMSKAIGFMIKLSLILAIVIALLDIFFIYQKYGSINKYVDKFIPEFSYENNKLSIDEEDSKTSDEKKEISSVMKQLEPNISEMLGNTTYNKAQLIDDIKNNENQCAVIGTISVFLESFSETIVFWLIVALMTSLIGWMILSMSKLKMKYSKLFSLSIYASTLTVLLTVIYQLINSFFGVYIEVFDYLVMLIAYIYITAVIYMIKSDLIKQQVELIKIATIQAKVKEQLKEDKENKEEKDKEDKNKEENKKENSENKEKKDKENDVVDDEPDGSEI